MAVDQLLGEDVVLRSSWPRHEADEIDAAIDVLESGRVNSLVHGEETEAFEREFADYIGCDYAISVANGTVALELALRALDIGPGDEVIVPARSFFATASSVVAAGARPVFADIDVSTHNIDPRSVERMLSERTRAVICVHLAGYPCDMPTLLDICRQRGLKLIEDCAQAHGAALNGKRVGSFGDVAAFSFCTDKIMSTGGEGGMVTTSRAEIARRVWSYKDHGKNREKVRDGAAGGSAFRFVHDSFGSNFRSTELQAAIGRRQLAKLPSWLERRSANAMTLRNALRDHPHVQVPRLAAGVEPAWYKFNVDIDVDALKGEPSIEEIVTRARERGVPCGTGSCPDMSREAAFDSIAPRRDGALRNAQRVGRRNLMLAVDHTLDRETMESIARVVVDAVR